MSKTSPLLKFLVSPLLSAVMVASAGAVSTVPINTSYKGVVYSSLININEPLAITEETNCSVMREYSFDAVGDLSVTVETEDYGIVSLDPFVLDDGQMTLCARRTIGNDGFGALNFNIDLDLNSATNTPQTYINLSEAGVGLLEGDLSPNALSAEASRRALVISPDGGLLLENTRTVGPDNFEGGIAVAVKYDDTLTAADLEGESFSGSRLRTEFIQTGQQDGKHDKAVVVNNYTLAFSAGGVCGITYADRGAIFTATENDSDEDINNGNDELADIENSTIGVHQDNSYSFPVENSCAYTVGSGGLIDVRVQFLDQENLVNGVNYLHGQYLLDQTGEYLTIAQAGGTTVGISPASGVVSESEIVYRGLGLLLKDEARAGTQASRNDAVAGTYLFQSAYKALEGSRSLDEIGLGVLELSLNGALDDADWNSCSLEEQFSAAELEITGSAANNSVLGKVEGRVEGADDSLVDCRYQVSAAGRFSLQLSSDEDGDNIADEVGVIEGYVASTGEALVLSESGHDGGVELSTGFYVGAEDSWALVLVGVKYNGDLTADADGDGLSNKQEYFAFDNDGVMNGTNDMVGAWTIGSPDSAAGSLFVFNADGSYILTDIEEHGETAVTYGTAGLESGSYAYDGFTGELFILGQYIDTNGDSGLSSVSNVSVVVDGANQLTLTIEGGGYVSITRVIDSAQAISGAWQQCDGANTAVFFDNNNAVINLEPYQNDVERGTFSWDSNTSQLMAPLAIDTNTDFSGFTPFSMFPNDIDALISNDIMIIQALGSFNVGIYQRVGSEACDADGDNDGISDIDEINSGLNPADPSDALLDLDGDGLTNTQEIEFGTGINNADTDFDGMPDGFEVANGFNPNDQNDGFADADGDGFNNSEEYVAGTDFNDDQDFPLPAAIIGAWTAGDPKSTAGSLLIFNADGTYIQTDIEEQGETATTYGTTGLEYGSYTYNNNTGILNAPSFLPGFIYPVDTNGDAGLSGIFGDINVTVNSVDQIDFEFYDQEQGETATLALVRVTDSNEPISGAWQSCTYEGINSVFFDDGIFISLSAFDNNVERGSYTWDSLTNDFVNPVPEITNVATGLSGAVGLPLKAIVNNELLLFKAFDAINFSVSTRVGGNVTCTTDSDFDGMPDAFELMNDFDSADPADGLLDADGDGLSNVDEYYNNANPRNADTDADGMPDLFEVSNGLDASDSADAFFDYDSDGAINLVEYQSGTNIYDPQDVPVVGDNSALVGAWTIDDPASAAGTLLVFGPEGTYTQTDIEEQGETQVTYSTSGGESGFYSYNDISGNLYTNAPYDTNGDAGLSGLAGIIVNVDSADQLTFSFFDDEQGETANIILARVTDNAEPISGVWQQCSVGSRTDVVFFDSGTFINLATNDIERGTYTWNSATNGLVIDGPLEIDGGYYGAGYSNAVGFSVEAIIGNNQMLIRAYGSSFATYLRVGSGAVCSGDSDGDGMQDFYELLYDFDPTDPADGAIDSDGDGLSNFDESIASTNPRNSDSDGDGIPDGFELDNGLSPFDYFDAALDFDGDNATNLDEYLGGTDLYNSQDYPLIVDMLGAWISATDSDLVVFKVGGKLQQSYLSAPSRQGDGTYSYNIDTVNNTVVITNVQLFSGSWGNDLPALFNADGDIVVAFDLINNQITLSYSEAGVAKNVVYSKVTDNTQAISGAWQACGVDGAAVFKSDGALINTIIDSSDVEIGSYSWDANDSEFTLNSLSLDLTPETGFSIQENNEDPNLVVQAIVDNDFLLFQAYSGAVKTAVMTRIVGGGANCSTDSDFDGMPDYYELLHDLELNIDDAYLDKDNDGLGNREEFSMGSSASNPDTDGDGLPDLFEFYNGTNISFPDGDFDNDGDGATNLEEYEAGTNINDSLDFPSTGVVKNDFDGDGDSDILFRDETTGQNLIWLIEDGQRVAGVNVGIRAGDYDVVSK